jgi:hypothetical protein
MKNTNLLRVGLGLSTLIVVGSAYAGVILTLEDHPVQGDPLEHVLVTISGLGDHASPSLSSFNLDVIYDPLILSFTGVGGPTELSPGGPFGNSIVHPGLINVFFGSTVLTGTQLNAVQPSSFLLLDLTFAGIGNGVSPVSISPESTLLDENGKVLAFSSTIADVAVGVVPDSGTTVSFLALSLGSLIALRQRKTQSQGIAA